MEGPPLSGSGPLSKTHHKRHLMRHLFYHAHVLSPFTGISVPFAASNTVHMLCFLHPDPNLAQCAATG